MRETLFLHIGCPKTGSSSIQNSFFASMPVLEKHGFDYFSYAANHSTALYWLFSERRHLAVATARMRLTEVDLDREMEAIDRRLKGFLGSNPSGRHKIISGEDISSLTDFEVERLKEYLERNGDLAIKIVVYVRNYYTFLDSIVQERIKHGACLGELGDSILNGGQSALPMYQFRIQKFQEIFGKSNVDVRVFEPAFLEKGDVVADFCQVIGAPVGLYDALTRVRSNPAICAEAVQILSKYNELFPIRAPTGERATRSDKVRAYFNRLEGARFCISDPEVLAAYDQYTTEDKAWVTETLGTEAAAKITVLREERAPTPLQNGESIDVNYLYRTFNRILLDTESNYHALEVCLGIAEPNGEEQALLASVTENLRFVNSDAICRKLARAMIRIKRLRLAHAVAQRAVQLNPANVENHRVRGDVLRQRGNWLEAATSYRQLLALAPSDAPAHRRLSLCMLRLGRKKEALTEAQKALDLAPDNESFRTFLNRVVSEVSEPSPRARPGHARPSSVEPSCGEA